MIKSNGEKSSETEFKLLSQQKITDDYVLLSAFDGQSGEKFAVALSTNELVMFDTKTGTKTLSYRGHNKTVTRVKFSKENPCVLFSSSLDGSIHIWDTRKGLKPAQTFSDDTDGSLKPITCFDFNVDEHYVCGGTELIREDSFLIFWDKRTSKCLGGYWNSHTDEVTNVQFHSTDSTSLASSSLDGLINIYDLKQDSEDDALLNTLNSNLSVINFTWDPKDQISLITGTEDYQFWSTEKTSPSFNLSRLELSEKYKPDIHFLINVQNVNDSSFLAAGSNDGTVQLLRQSDKGLDLCGTFVNGHNDIVRTFSASRECFVTGGEDGHVCIWESNS